MSPGACPHALATEVYARTMRCVRRRYGHNPRHSQAVHDAVGEAFLRWYKSSADKTEHSAGEHALWLTGTAGSHLLDSDPHRRKAARAVRSIASYAPDATDDGIGQDDDRVTARHEDRLRRFRGAPDFASAEDDYNDALDAWRAGPPPPPATPAEALAVLKHRDWTDLAIARTIGVSRPTVAAWRVGRAPSDAAAAALLDLVVKDALAPNTGRRPPSKMKRR